MQREGSIFSKKGLKHIFIGDFKPKKKRRRLSGAHYEQSFVIVRRRVRVGYRSGTDRNGVYKAYVSLGARASRFNVFFPAHWSRARVLEAIRDVYSQIPEDYRGRYWQSQTSDGVMVRLHLNGEGRIITAYPVQGSKTWHCRICNRHVPLARSCRCGYMPIHLRPVIGML